ncbi:hypothetical protein HMN09_01109800 [Mycena chlorophos]|uniref:Uncharacterized protein n=1 Tax=Mycena chlorophos TaxID=658473 RepID=A0A8H6SEK3_MYCCL|nr:hypothetical protein HMN09_01109800 [Mycena chlorophos]
MACPAIDGHTKTTCGRAIAPEHTWCPHHHSQQRKAYTAYKNLSDKLETYDNTRICMRHDTIAACADLLTLESWAIALRDKHALCLRAIATREDHHRQFYEGGDEGHRRYIEDLYIECDVMVAALAVIAQRHDELSGIVLSESAEPECDADEIEAVMEYHTPTSDHFLTSLITRPELLERLFSFRKFQRIHKLGSEEWGRFVDFMERVIIQALRRRSGMRTLLASPNIDGLDLEEFLANDSLLTLDELKQIYVAVHLTSPRHVLRSINDSFRSGDPAKEPHTMILGRRIYYDPSPTVCLDAWDMFEDFMPERKWAMHAAPTLTAWTEVDRIISLGLRFTSWQPHYLDIDAGPVPASIAFPLSGVFIQYEWKQALGKIIHLDSGEWIEIDQPAALYLKFSESARDGRLFFQRVVSVLQEHSKFFGFLPIASAHFDLDAGNAQSVIHRLPTSLNAGRWRSATEKARLEDAAWVDLPYFTLEDVRDKFTGSGPFAMADPGGVLHLLVTDRLGVGEDSLRNHLATILLWIRMYDWDAPPLSDPYSAWRETEPPSQLDFFRVEMRVLCNPTIAPALGAGQEGLVAIAAGAIHVEGESFRRFKDRLTQILERHADANLVRRWMKKKLRLQQKDAVRCWHRHKEKLERMACCQGFFFLGTADGRDELKKMLGREISPDAGALQLYHPQLIRHVFVSAWDRAREAEKMMPPREERQDWENAVQVSDKIDCDFDFMAGGKGKREPTSAQIVEILER